MSRIICSLILIGAYVSVASADERPNLVIFLADDAGWGDYSRNGNTQVQTPHIDSLARDGVTLDRFFVCPLCSLTRAEFLTGRYYPRGGVRGVSTGQERLNLDERTVADAFKAAGYATGAFGKWHNGTQWPYHPMARGFDQYFGHSSGHWGEYFDAPLEENGRMIRTRGYIVDTCTDQAIDFIQRNQAKPFFCYLPFTTPHSPWAAPEKDWQRFKDKPITQRAQIGAQENIDETRCVLAMIENQDENVGRVLAKLEELKLARNTIVLYFSDNGPNSWRWNGGMKGRKGGTDEGSVRSTCFLRWPAKVPADHVVTQISGAIDLLPTLTALAGIPRVGDQPLDGLDLSRLLLRQEVAWPDRIIFSTWGGQVSARSQKYRLDAQGKLFDMVQDPKQWSAIEDREPGVALQMSDAVKAWKREMFDKSTTAEAFNAVKRPIKLLGGNAVDPRPLPVGYREFPITMLPARDGEPHGTVKRSSAAPNCSYFVNWTSKDDRMEWMLDVHTTGRYEATIDCTCPESSVGSLIELSFRESRLAERITTSWDPPLNTNQDTLPRPHGESQMKEFRPLRLGTIHLEQGQGALTLRALEINGKNVMDVRRVTLTFLD